MKHFIPKPHHCQVEIIVGAHFKFARFGIAIQIAELLVITDVAVMEFLALMHIIPQNRSTEIIRIFHYYASVLCGKEQLNKPKFKEYLPVFSELHISAHQFTNHLS